MVVVMRAQSLALVLMTVLFAGCLGGADDVDDPAGGNGTGGPDAQDAMGFQKSEDTQLETDLDAFRLVPSDEEEFGRGNVSLDDWYLLSTSTSSSGKVAGFQIEVPNDVLVGSELILEFAPAIGPMGVDVFAEDVVYSALLLKEDASVEDVYVQSAINMATAESEETFFASAAPFTLRGGGIAGGDTVHVVIAARGGGSEFGLGMRISDDGGLEDNAASVDSWDQFSNGVGEGVNPFVPERTIEGDGLHYAYFEEIHEESSFAVHSTPDVSIADDTPDGLYPDVTTRMITVGSEAGWGGWSEFSVRYASAGEPGQWAANVDLHGAASAAQEGLFLNLHFQEQIPIQGEPPVSFWGEGEGGSGASIGLSLTKVGTVATFEHLVFEHFSIGMQPSELVGVSDEPDITFRGGLPLPEP